MMFQQFMQMGTPAALAIIGFMFSIGGMFIAVVARGQVERNARRKYELDRIQQAAMAKQIEHKGGVNG